MTTSETYSEQERIVLKWGGLAGVFGSLSLVAVFVFLAGLVGLDTLDVEQELQRYPEIRTIRVLENTVSSRPSRYGASIRRRSSLRSAKPTSRWPYSVV